MKGAVIKTVAEFAEVITGGTPSTTKPEYWDGDIPWLNSGSLNEGVITAPSKFITQLGLANSSAKLMPKDTVLVALTGATTGQVGYLAIEASANQSVTGILPSKEHHPKYLYFFLKSQRQKMLGDAFGGAQPHINQRYVKDFKIPLPSLDDQIRIADLLGKVEGLIAQRKQHLQQLDDLLKSVFLEMFGDPVRNERGWKIGSLGSYGSFKNGLNFGKGESGVTVRYLGVGDFKSKAALDDFDSLGFIELNELPAEDYFLHDSDLLFVRSNGNRELVGRCMAVYPGKERATYSGFCIRYRITDASLLAIYVAHLFRSAAFRRVLLQGGQGANIQNINQLILSGLPIPVPDEDCRTSSPRSLKRSKPSNPATNKASRTSKPFTVP